MLSPDIKRYIASDLDISDCHNLFQVNKFWSKLSFDDRFWNLKLLIDYRRSDKGIHKLYRDAYIHIHSIIHHSTNEYESFPLNHLPVLGSYSIYRMIDNIIKINVPNISLSLNEWKPILKRLIQYTDIPYIEHMILFIKYLIRKKYPFDTKYSLVLTDTHLNYGIEFYNPDHKHDPFVLCIDNIIQYQSPLLETNIIPTLTIPKYNIEYIPISLISVICIFLLVRYFK